MNTETDDVTTAATAPRAAIPREAFLFVVITVLAAAGVFYMHKRASLAPPQADAEVEMTQFLSTGPAQMQAISAKISRTRQLLSQFDSFALAQQVAYSDFASDPFSPASENVQEPVAVDQSQQDIRDEASQLRLQSIVHSSARRACLIDGRLYREGQSVQGFTIESIRAGNIIVQKGRYRFELRVGR